MFKNFQKIIILFGIIIILASCGTGRISSLVREPNEAIIVAKIQIKNGNSFVTSKWNFLWDERLWANWAVWPDEQNYVYMKIPVGKHFIAMLQYKMLHKNIADNYLTIDIKENKIYYIGDIVINWDIDSNNDNSSEGAFGAIADADVPGEKLKVDIIDNYEETIKYFKSKFPSDEIIGKELLKINK